MSELPESPQPLDEAQEREQHMLSAIAEPCPYCFANDNKVFESRKEFEALRDLLLEVESADTENGQELIVLQNFYWSVHAIVYANLGERTTGFGIQCLYDAAYLLQKQYDVIAGLKAERDPETKRLRRLVNLLDLGSAVPESDGELRAVLFSVIGMACRKVEELKAEREADKELIKQLQEALAAIAQQKGNHE